MKSVYRSRIDLLLPLVIIFITVVVLYPFDSISIQKVLFIIVFNGFMLYLFFSIRYEIEGENLIIKSLFYTKEIPIKEILSIERSYNPLSSPAAAIKRIEIVYGDQKNYILISPQKELEFIKTLSKINPKILVKV